MRALLFALFITAFLAASKATAQSTGPALGTYCAQKTFSGASGYAQLKIQQNTNFVLDVVYSDQRCEISGTFTVTGNSGVPVVEANSCPSVGSGSASFTWDTSSITLTLGQYNAVFSTNTPCAADSSSSTSAADSSSSNVGAIVGGVVGAVVVLALIAVVVYVVKFRQAARTAPSPSSLDYRMSKP